MAKHRRSRRRRSLGQIEGGGISPWWIVGGVAVIGAGVGIYFLTRPKTAALPPLRQDDYLQPPPGYDAGGGFYSPGDQTVAAVDQLAADLIKKYGEDAVKYIAQYGAPAAADYLADLFDGGAGGGTATTGKPCPNLNKYPKGTCAQFKQFGPRAHKRGTAATGDENCWYGWTGSRTTIWSQDPAVVCR